MSRIYLLFFIIGLISLCVNSVSAHEWMAPEEAAKRENPVTSSGQSITRGKEVYSQNCTACHGENMEGMDGQKLGLENNPPNLKERISTHSDGDFFWKIQEGRGGMPAFKEDLSEQETWEVINFIRFESE